MKTEPLSDNCPRCGAPIPADAPRGLCPKCVLSGAATTSATEPIPSVTGEIPTLERVAAAFPQLEIVELIGRGGMGFVFKARQPHLDRFVALKLLTDKLAKDPQFSARFNREGRVLARLNHPNIVSVFDFGKTEEFYFLTMEYVDGVNLRQAMGTGRFSPSEALSIVPKICEALQFAHEQGVLHRDIKPENILLDTRGQVKIADFGIAKLVGEDPGNVTLTNAGSALGTPHYMAPEQLEQPSTVDHRADIYSLGVVFYEMLTGELPIGRFEPPSTKTPVSEGVDDAVMRALERNRERRQGSARELKTEVETASGDAPKTTGSQGLGNRLSLKAVYGAALVGLALVLLVGPITFSAVTDYTFTTVQATLFGVCCALAALAGTILGWVGLGEIRQGRGRVGGLVLALFAALSWPLFIVFAVTMALPSLTLVPGGSSAGPGRLGQALVLVLPASVMTLIVWSILATSRWASGQPVLRRSRVLIWVFVGVIVFGLGVQLIFNTDGPSATRSEEARLRLPDGALELMALSDHPSSGVWWRPDGTDWEEGTLDNPGVSHEPKAGERVVEMVFRSHGLKPGDSSPQFEIDDHGGWGGATGVKLNGQTIPGSHLIAAAFPVALEKTTVRVRVGVDDWETLADSGSNARSDVSLVRDGRPVKVTFQGAHEKGSNTVLIASYDVGETDVRVVAITLDGVEHSSLLSSRSRNHLEAEFVDLPRESIREFHFQVRPYRWTLFEDVNLRPREGRSSARPVTRSSPASGRVMGNPRP